MYFKQQPKVFALTINNTDPIVFYCPQTFLANTADPNNPNNANTTTTESECSKGMSGVVNADIKDLQLYRCASKETHPSGAPPALSGGSLLDNPKLQGNGTGTVTGDASSVMSVGGVKVGLAVVVGLMVMF